MDLLHWENGRGDPFREFEALQDEINKLFDVARVPEPRGIFEGALSPAADVIENPNSFEVLCDLPGIEIGDVEISLAGSVLTIKGEKKASQPREAAHSYREEMRAGRFQRTFQLPLPVDGTKVDAELKDGVLRVVLPKDEDHKPRQISVKVK